MDLKSLLEAYSTPLLEMRVRFNDTKGKDLPNGSVIFGYSDSIWVIPKTSWKEKKEEIAADIRQKMGLPDNELNVKWAYSPEALVDFADTRSDVVAFEMNGGRMLYRRHTYGQSPQTSPLFRKVATYIKNTYGVPIDPFSMGMRMNTGGSVTDVDPSTFRGTLPKEGWHGTNIDALSSILKKGIMPQSSGNYGDVHTKGYIFFAADKSSLVHGYAMQSAGGAWSLKTFPVLVHFRIPDQDKIKPDVDIANNLYGKKSAQLNPDYKHLPFTDKGADQPNSAKGKKNPERMWKHSELFGYKGRIPPSHILSFTSYEKLGGENISLKQMAENIKAWDILKTKFEPKQIIGGNVSWVGKSATQIVADVTKDIENTQKNGVKESMSKYTKEEINEQFSTETGEVKKYNGNKYVGASLLWKGKKFAEVYAYSDSPQSKLGWLKFSAPQSAVVRWGYKFVGTKIKTPQGINLGFYSRNEAVGAALEIYRRNMRESLDEASIVKDNRKYANVKWFETDKEANDFLEKNPEYGVLQADKDGVYVAKNNNKGRRV